MNRSRYIVVVAVVISTCIGFQAWAGEAGAQAVESAWVKAMKENSLDGVMACYAADAIGWFPGMAETKGAPAIRAAYEEMLTANTIKDAALSETQHRTEGKVSTGWGKFSLTMVNKETGKTAVMSGRFTEVVVKRDGKWVYLVDHASAEPAPAPKP